MQSLLNENWRCVAFDHRAHGQSDGKLTSFGYHEREDVRAVYALIQQQWPHQPAVALGVSMGAAAICYAAEVGVKWDAVVLESVYDNIVSTFQRRIGGPYPDWFGLLIPPVAEMIEQRLSLKVDDLVPQRALLQLQPTPLLVVHGAQDEFAPAEIARQIHQSYSGPSELWMIDGAGHYDLWEIAGDRYGKRVVSFLNRQTRRATRSPRAA
jgi:pimeloyl-ACP methyl ester carboxylesterase